MKKILGLDLGTNSIGWALIEHDFNNKKGKIIKLGSRIIPMSQDELGKFDSGTTVSQTADRTHYRSIRRLYERSKLRRDRIHRVLNLMGFLPQHYAQRIDFINNPGQFKNGNEPKINYKRIDGHFQFIFKDSFEEMAKEFKEHGYSKNIPYDWTIYYLRKKALKEKISKEELAWVILNFNQKRGYFQLRGDEIEEEKSNKNEEYHSLKVNNVEATEDTNSKGTWYNVELENGWIYRRQSKEPLFEWKGTYKEFIVTTSYDKNGELAKDKEGNIKRSFKAVNSKDDWIAIKKKTENDILNSEKTVGTYIYENLLKNPALKVKGKLVRTIERKFYKNELKEILEEQTKHHLELHDKGLYKKAINELYPFNKAHKENIKDKDFTYLFLEDIIFYQRPLKSKKSSIANCQYEERKYKKKVEVEAYGKKTEKEMLVSKPLKGTPKSNPIFQEFRLWQFLRNLKIYKKEAVVDGKREIDVDYTNVFLPDEESWVELFNFLSDRAEIDQKQLLDYFVRNEIITKSEKEEYRWNYVPDKKYPCNETKAYIVNRLSKIEGVDQVMLSDQNLLHQLWHIIYSIKEKKEYKSALKSFATRWGIDEDEMVDKFNSFPPFENDYASYSEKAIKKLLPLMRVGKYWSKEKIPAAVFDRGHQITERLETIDYDIKKIDDTITDDDVPARLLRSFARIGNSNIYKGLNTFQACYLVYNRHSEIKDLMQWRTPKDIENYLSEFKQHSLRNPIVEQVVTETLRVVKDIWDYYGEGQENYFDEIHVELGREMKNPANKRKEISNKVAENENTNYRIRELLKELKNDESIKGEIKPYSPSHQEILKIYEEGVYHNPRAKQSQISIDEIDKIRKSNAPTKTEIIRYKLWLEQGYLSPYTGKVIPLSKLFTTKYQIEHIIPQSRYFDDSLSNKIICESEVNSLKDNRTAYQFLKEERGRIVELSGGESVKLFTPEEYEEHCNDFFSGNRAKLKKLMSEEIPEGFIERQLNDSRYISKLVKGLLSNILRDENEQEAISKKLVPVSGSITSVLRHDWGLNDKWNELVAPRFKRLNAITNSNDYGYWDDKIQAFRTSVPDPIMKGFNKKRIDHRHHALDALVVACTTKDHVSYITALNTQRNNYSLVKKLRKTEKREYVDRGTGEIKQRTIARNYRLPWDSFPVEAYDQLLKTIVSFKQNIRVINKANNKTWNWVKRNGVMKKEMVSQTKGDSWAIRKPMHKQTVSGSVKVRDKKEVSFNNGLKEWENLVDKRLKLMVKKHLNDGKSIKEITKLFMDKPYEIDGKPVSNVKIYTYTNGATAYRVPLTEKFTRKQLNAITDSGIKKILNKHVNKYIDEKGKERFDLAFSDEGLKNLNKNIIELNNGKFHHPIYKARVYEVGNKFPVGEVGNKSKKYVEAEKGTNLFFAIYWNEEKQKREYETIPLNEVIEHQKWRATLTTKQQETVPLIPVNKNKGDLLFYLSPNDLVYVPDEDESFSPGNVSFEDLSEKRAERIYKMVSTTQDKLECVPHNYAKEIVKNEMGANNKSQNTIDDNIQIKSGCLKLETDRLGNIIRAVQ